MSKIWGVHPQKWRAKIAYFVTILISTKLCRMTKNRGLQPPCVNTRHSYGASGIRWRRIANINGAIEIKSLVTRRPQNFQFAMASRRAALSVNRSLSPCTFSSYFSFTRLWLRYVRVIAIANPSVVCCLSVCRLSVICNVCAPYTQGVETFGNTSSPFCTLAIFWPPCKFLRRWSQWNSSVRGVKRKSGSKIERCHVIRVSHLPISFLLISFANNVDKAVCIIIVLPFHRVGITRQTVSPHMVLQAT